MRYVKLSCVEFYSCYLQQCLSIDLFSYRTLGRGQKGHLNKVCSSFCSEVSLKLAVQFFLELNMVLGAHLVLCMTEPDFLKIMFCPQNRENKRSLGFFECVGKFSLFSQFFNFFSIWSIMKVYLTVCSCHATYAFESESTLYSCLNFKELLARSRREI